MESNKPAACDGDLSQVNQLIELEAERPRKIMIEVRVKDMSLIPDENDDEDNSEPDESVEDNDEGEEESVQDNDDEEDDDVPILGNCGEDESIPPAIASDAPSISDTDQVRPIPFNVANCSGQPSSKKSDESWFAGLTDARNDTNASFKRLLSPLVPQSEERSLRQHFYRYGPPPPVVPLPLAPTLEDDQVPECSTISPKNADETKDVCEKPPLRTEDVLELERELIRSYSRLDPSKIKTYL